MPVGWNALATERINRIVAGLETADDADGGRLFNQIIPTRDASDMEIILRLGPSRPIAADIIQMDQAARVIRGDAPETIQSVIPKLKHGHQVSEHMLSELARLQGNLATAQQDADASGLLNYIDDRIDWLLQGVRDRRELLLAAMLVDDGDYNRFGIQFTNLSWGMPSALNITVGTAWSNAGTATPLANIEAALETAEDDYDEMYDTVVMTRGAFGEMEATDEFINRSQSYLQMRLASGILPADTFPTGNRESSRLMAEAILSRDRTRPVRFVIYNKRTRLEATDGSRSTVQFLPDDKVLLLDSNDFGNDRAWDFANAPVMETLPGLVPNLIGGFEGGGGERGPVGYATAGDSQGNPPGQVLWACQRGFPRKHRESANAVLTI